MVLYNSVHIYAFSSPPEKLSVFETANNPFGLCCLGSKIVAFPGRTPGQVQLVEIGTGNVSIIPAHATALKAMEISPDGEVLATASETVYQLHNKFTWLEHRLMDCERVHSSALFPPAIVPAQASCAVELTKPLSSPSQYPLVASS